MRKAERMLEEEEEEADRPVNWTRQVSISGSNNNKLPLSTKYFLSALM